MKIIIPGGSGQVGQILARSFHEQGDEVVVLSRAAGHSPWRVVSWDAINLASWVSELEGADAVINLAGRSVNCRYHAANRRAIMESRIQSTKVIGAAIATLKSPPKVWLQSSTATIYAHRFDAPNDEFSGIIGGNEPHVPDTWRFSFEVAKAWETAVEEASTPLTRKVMLRSAMTMSPDAGGIFDVLLRLVRFGLGGRAGNGRQYISWIHDEDFIRAVRLIIENDRLVGPVNLAAPTALPNTEFMAALRKAWGQAIGLPATEWMIELGTRVMRTESELVLKSRRVIPKKLMDEGFDFHFPTWPQAAQNLCQRWRKNRH
jgi:hypothetical protein